MFELRPGNYYRLTETVENEHQDHLFTYPQGMILQLDSINLEDCAANAGLMVDTEDGPVWVENCDKRVICHWITADGLCNTFDPALVVPATAKQYKDCKIKVIIEPCA